MGTIQGVNDLYENLAEPHQRALRICILGVLTMAPIMLYGDRM